MNVLIFLALIALTLVVGARLGLRTMRAVQDTNRRINADIAYLRAIPSDMDWGQK